MELKTTDIIIIGSGVTGLTIGHYLKKAKKDFLILEKNNRAGGVIHTEVKNDFLFENGPNTAMISNVEVVNLLDDLKDQFELQIGSKIVNKRYVLKNKKWQAMPMGIMSAVTTPLYTFPDKLKVLTEPFRKKGDKPHESLADLVKRRLGQSFLDYAIDPFILGIYAGDPSLLIPKYALPKLYNLEQDYGSFIKGAIKKKKEPKTDLEKRANKGMFSFKGGFQSLINALQHSVGLNKFVFETQNVQVEKQDDKYKVSYIDAEGTACSIIANKVISTTGSHEIENSFKFIPQSQLQHFQSLKYARVVEVALGFNKWEGMPLDGFGGLIPHKEKRKLLGVMFMSSLFKGRAPKGGALLSIFLGGIRQPEIIDKSDDEIKAILEEEFISLMGVDTFEPDLIEIRRHSYAIPQYGIESKERFETVKQIEAENKGLFIAGNLRDGIGMADRVAQATEIAKQLIH